MSEVEPMMLPRADWAAPVAESTYDWRVEVCLSDMFDGVVLKFGGVG